MTIQAIAPKFGKLEIYETTGIRTADHQYKGKGPNRQWVECKKPQRLLTFKFTPDGTNTCKYIPNNGEPAFVGGFSDKPVSGILGTFQHFHSDDGSMQGSEAHRHALQVLAASAGLQQRLSTPNNPLLKHIPPNTAALLKELIFYAPQFRVGDKAADGKNPSQAWQHFMKLSKQLKPDWKSSPQETTFTIRIIS